MDDEWVIIDYTDVLPNIVIIPDKIVYSEIVEF